MANSKDSLILYTSAMRDGRHKDAVKIVTNIINKTKDKEDLVECFRLRIDAANKDGDYDIIVRDCQRLIQLGFDFDGDIPLSLIKLEAEGRLTLQDLGEKFKATSIRLDIELPRTWSNKLEIFTSEKLFKNDDDRIYPNQPVMSLPITIQSGNDDWIFVESGHDQRQNILPEFKEKPGSTFRVDCGFSPATFYNEMLPDSLFDHIVR